MMKPEGGSLLLVDDEEFNRDMLGRRLEIEGFSVTHAENGPRALELLADRTFDLVLLDVMMPEMNGIEVLTRIRQAKSAADLPIIMVTAKTQSEDMVEAFKFGANDYITKPIDFPVALARITTQLFSRKAQAALRESEMRYALAARGSNDGLWDWDLRKDEIYYSTRWKAMLGYDEHEVGTSSDEWFGRVHHEDLAHLQGALAAHRKGDCSHLEIEYRIQHKDKSFRWMLTRGMAVRDAAGNELRIAGSQTDITRGKAADALTGLPNRVLFMDRLGRALLKGKQEPNYLYAVMFLDLDRFKVINDSLGHIVGDQLLMGIARRLEKCLRSSDCFTRIRNQHTIARFGGDEFTILLDGIKLAENATAVAQRIQKELALPFHLSGHEVFTSASIGITIGASEYERAEDLLRDADTAMYCAKAAGKARSIVFDLAMRDKAIERLQLETDLRKGLERQEFVLHYQPILSLTSNSIVGFEALLRWQHPERGLVSPADFIPITEETGLIVPLGTWVLKEACRQMSIWRSRFHENPPQAMCVNLSCKQFSQPNLVAKIVEVLQEAGLPAECLKLEITESALMEDPKSATQILTQIRELGVRVGLDDFGTGYSSLSYLRSFPIDTIKIDRSFVSQMDQTMENAEIVETIVALAHNLAMDVVAEGVEKPEQRDRLRELTCEYGQGYYFSRPVDSKAIEVLLAANPVPVPEADRPVEECAS